jgi:protein-disulfide isomerase
LSRLRTEYVTTGKVRFVYKHFAILGPDSNRAAEASECATEQGNFWDFHDTVFTNQATGQADLSDDSLIAQATTLGLDVEAFTECLDSGRYVNQIRQESLSVQSMGIRGTPAFLVNGVFVSGAQPFGVFQESMDGQLTELN